MYTISYLVIFSPYAQTERHQLGQERANDTSYEYNTCQGLALISIITDEYFDFEHVTLLFCNTCGVNCLNEVLLLF